MSLSEIDRRALRSLEESLWKEETRFDRNFMERILAQDFSEIGASGQTYRREETLAAAPQPIGAKLSNFSMKLLANDIALVTYASEDSFTGSPRQAHRSSIWSRDSKGEWVLRFHQGTLVP